MNEFSLTAMAIASYSVLSFCDIFKGDVKCQRVMMENLYWVDFLSLSSIGCVSDENARFLLVIKSILARDYVFPFYGQSLPVLWGLLSSLACPAEGYVRKDCPDSHILTFRQASQDLQHKHCSQFNSLTTSSFKVSEVQNRGRPKVKSVTCSHYAKALL